MNEQQVAELIRKYNEGTLKQDEKTALDIWYLKYASESTTELSQKKEDRMVAMLKSNLPLRPKKPIVKLWPGVAIAAAVLLVIFSAGLYYFYPANLDTQYTIINTGKDIAPGKNGATLTLSNGKKILIKDALAGNIATDLGVKITKTKDGQIVYVISSEQNDERTSTSIQYNTLSTTSGEQTQVQLQDGTLVYLNAESSLTYPTSFAKAEKRLVSMTGEAYFEVAKERIPFIVQTNNQQVEVLGTHFNINAYADEPAVKTTLLEGSVKVSNLTSHLSNLLKPGEQSIIKNFTLDTRTVEIDDIVAWKNGYFMFNNETLESIMKKVARWYNVEVVYKDESIKQKTFFGSVSRFAKVSEMLTLLQQTDAVVFEINGNQIIVRQKK